MKFKGTLIGEASGSLASLTFSHNRGGQYVRQRAVPTNPATEFQIKIRNFVAGLTSEWNNVLTQAQRDAWDTYALNVPMPDSLGEPRNVGGLAMFTRSNVPRLQAEIPQVNDAPTIFNLGEFTAPTINKLDATNDELDLNFTNTDEWANEDDSALLVYMSRPMNASINFFKGPYRFAGRVDGDGTTPPTSPATFTAPFSFAVGNKVAVQVRVSRADGRLSSEIRLQALGTA